MTMVMFKDLGHIAVVTLRYCCFLREFCVSFVLFNCFPVVPRVTMTMCWEEGL